MPRIQCFMIEPVEEKSSNGKITNRKWKRVDTGEVKEHSHDFGPGAMWYADWLVNEPGTKFVRKDDNGNDVEIPQPWGNGPDGKVLMVLTPGGSWIIDSRASNCTMPTDNEHRCWIRTGIPPLISVHKNGLTCGAGAGSIQCGNYHGFLRSGFLED